VAVPFIISGPGVYEIDEESYHTDACLDGVSLSSSGARMIIDDCPALFREKQLRPWVSTKAQDLGKAAHAWLLEGTTWINRFEVLPEDHVGNSATGRRVLRDIKRAGLTPLSHKDFRIIRDMREALLAHKFAHGAFENGLAEKSLYWKDPLTGIWCRSRNDYLPRQNRVIADYKSTKRADPRTLPGEIYKYGYYQQADWYMTGVRELGLIEDPVFLFVFQEKTPPYLVTCETVSNAALRWGAMMNRKAREIFADCLEAGHWPGYTEKIGVLDLPQYAEYQLVERENVGEFSVRKGEPL